MMFASLYTIVRRLMLAFGLCFLLPVAASALWWTTLDRPGGWRAADWGASGILPAAAALPDAAIHVMAARTGGFKGAVSVHSWLVWKSADATTWSRAEVVGWGHPVRRDAYAADARWYSNQPQIIGSVTGPKAAALIPAVEATVDAYPFNHLGSYVIWPGPNSNTFVAHILRENPGSVSPCLQTRWARITSAPVCRPAAMRAAATCTCRPGVTSACPSVRAEGSRSTFSARPSASTSHTPPSNSPPSVASAPETAGSGSWPRAPRATIGP